MKIRFSDYTYGYILHPSLLEDYYHVVFEPFALIQLFEQLAHKDL